MTEPVHTFDKHYAFKPHPLIPLPAPEVMAAELADPNRREALVKFLNGRAELLKAAEQDPLHHGLRLPQSKMVDDLLERYQMVYESGGKRAGKTEDGIPRFLKCCLAYGKAKRWAMQDNALSSVANLQQTVWFYLPTHIKALNNKRSAKYRVHYSPQQGFDGLLILPNGCEVYFLNYTQNPEDFLGWELGKSLEVALVPGIPDIGALLDENCPLAWLENIQLRCSTRGAKIHWMYSPQTGITPAIKELKANAKTTETRPAELLTERVNVPGVPRGQMPLVQVDEHKRLAIFYRFTEWNPFSGYRNPGGVRELCLGKNDHAYTMAHAYGYCEAVRGRAFPLFGEWNVVPESALPAAGTNWLVTDPQGARNWFALWARACPGNELYIYREWPDVESLGEWTVMSKHPKKLNGERGPAQPTIGYGPPQYKRLFKDLERVRVPAELRKAVVRKAEIEKRESGNEDHKEDLAALAKIVDAYHRRLVERALRDATEERPAFVQEEIYERLIDPRAGRNRTAAEGEGIDLITKLAEASVDRKSGETMAPMHFLPAPGLDLRDGISQINELLFFRQDEERIPIINAPKLYVSVRCRNLIWAMKNYSLPDDLERANDDACEDPIDCLRYLVTRGIRYIVPGGRVTTRGGGSY